MRRIIAAGAGVSLILAMVHAVNVATPSLASASPSVTVVTSADLYGFSCTNVGPSGTGQFNVIDEGACPSGGGISVVSTPAPTADQGSLQLTVNGTADHWAAFSYDHDGVALSAITSLSYSTYTTNGGPSTSPILQLVINPGTPSAAGIAANCPNSPPPSYSTLNFEPYLQSGGVVDNTWQTWNVMSSNGVVWGSHITACTPEAYSPSGISWNTFLSYYPNATIIGGVGVNVGSGWSGMTGNVGSLTFDSTTYVFDPTAPSPSTTTTPTDSIIALGQANTDLETVTGNGVVGSPTGTVSFYECGPTASPAPCTSMANPVGIPVNLTSAPGNASTATSAPYIPSTIGYWCFAGYYSGDSNYQGNSDVTVGECVNVVASLASFLQITTTSLPPGVVKTRYSATLVAIGGNPPYRWSRASGGLPGGLHLNRFNGVISGRPSRTDSGTYTFTIKVVDKKIRKKHHRPTQNTATSVLSIAIS